MSAKGTKAGNIFLDLTLNKQGFNTQLGSITKLAAKAGAAIAAAFSVKAIVGFSKECIELGSDLAEVQNVVNVTFPTMSSAIDKFAKDAAAQFGLSETMAKRYAGTLGSMAEAFGFSESQAAEMSTTLAGLAGDVASFYNLSQDEAYTKLKSVFTGETESLKDLGVVMTQAALDQYALANGYGKTTKAMSEAEKVALRYAFVQDQLSNASGDFARTSDSWANQVKVLQLRIESIKASIGQGLINLFKPILMWINTIIEKLQVAADAFARFTSFFTKKDASSSGASVSGELAAAAASSNSVSSGLSGAASAAKKLKRELAGFDKITKLSDADTGGGSSGSGGAGASLTGVGDLMSDAMGAIEQSYPFIEKMQEIFGGGIKQAKDDLTEFSKIKLSSIKDSLSGIADTTRDLKDSIVYIGQAFKSEAFEKIVTFFVKLNTAINLTVLDKVVGFAKDLLDFYVQPFIQNKDKIKEVFENIFEILSLIVSPLEKLIDLATSRAKKYEDGALHKFMEAATSTRVENAATVLDALNNGLEKIIDLLSGDIKLSDVLEDLFPYFFGDEKPEEVVVEFKAEIKQRWSELQGKWQNLTQNIKDKKAQFKAEIKQKWSDLQSKWNELTKNVKEKIAEMRAEVKQKWEDIKSKWTDLTQNVKDKVAHMRAEVAQKWSDLKGEWNELTKNFKDKVVNIFLNFSAAANEVKEWINSHVIDKINTAFDKVPILKHINLPHLAQGGYVKANTPQLAVIGDNRHQGEVVAPENKLAELARKGAELAGGGGRDAEIVALLRQMLELLKSMNLTAYIDAEGLKRLIVKLINDHTRATGQCEIYV